MEVHVVRHIVSHLYEVSIACVTKPLRSRTSEQMIYTYSYILILYTAMQQYCLFNGQGWWTLLMFNVCLVSTPCAHHTLVCMCAFCHFPQIWKSGGNFFPIFMQQCFLLGGQLIFKSRQQLLVPI